MRKIDRDLRKFVTALLKYADKRKGFPIDFTADEIPKIFNSWSMKDFNIIHYGVGIRCCIPMLPDQWRINIDHCRSLRDELSANRLKIWMLWLAILGLISILIFGFLNYKNDHKETSDNNEKTSEIKSEIIHN
jgi:hypothetical protein